MANTIQAIETSVANGGVAFDYSEHFNLLNNLVERIAIAAEQISANVSIITQQQIVMANQQITMANQQTIMAAQETIMAAQETIMAAQQVKISDDIRVLKLRGENDKLGIVSRGVDWDAYGRANKALIEMALDDTGATEPQPILRNNYNKALGEG